MANKAFLQYETAEVTRIGDRLVNEDRVAVARKDDAVLLMVADGLGGHPRGDLAAATTVETFVHGFVAGSLAEPHKLLAQLVNAAHRAVVKQGTELSPPAWPLTTCVACLVHAGRAWHAHVGDSRFYLFRDGDARVRSRDHTMAAELHAQGLISADEISLHPGRNRLSRCLGGVAGTPEATFSGPVELAAGDVLVLCSDGLWSPLSEAEMAAALVEKPLQPAVEALADRARAVARPASDNVSLAALRVHTPRT